MTNTPRRSPKRTRKTRRTRNPRRIRRTKSRRKRPGKRLHSRNLRKKKSTRELNAGSVPREIHGQAELSLTNFTIFLRKENSFLPGQHASKYLIWSTNTK